MRFRLVVVGKLDKLLRAAADEYLRRIQRYIKFEIVDVADAKGVADAGASRAREARRILEKAGSASLVAITREGSHATSRELAVRLDKWKLDAKDIAFVIGGSDGLDQTVLDRCATTLSLSRMTMPHDLARLVFLEQIYRASTILRGEPYHRGP